MTRKFLDQIKTDMETILPDNLTNEVSPADIRTVITDVMDSTKQDEGVISGGAVGVAPLDGVFQSLASFDTEEGDDAIFLKLNAAAGQIQTASTAGYTYQISAKIAFDAGNNNLEFTIGMNGTPIGFITRDEGAGNNDQVTIQVGYFSRSTPADAVFTLMVRAVDGSANLNVVETALAAVIWPTNNP